MRIRTEYMKKFKDPKWESYSKCYEELLRYRMSRRLLEHSHKPWFWTETDSDSDVSDSPTQSKENPTETVTSEDRHEAEEYEQCRGEGIRSKEEKGRVTLPGSTETVPKILLPGPVEDVSPSASVVDGDQTEVVGGLRPQVEEEREGQRANSSCGKQPRPPARQPDPGSHPLFQLKTSKPTKAAQRVQRVRSAPKHKEDNVEGRHPFALYGRGERSADMAAKRTHNVGPAASTGEIHESALRAKTRREVARLLQTQRAQQRRAASADLDHNRTRPAPNPEFNPWLTEYMSCFAAHSR